MQKSSLVAHAARFRAPWRLPWLSTKQALALALAVSIPLAGALVFGWPWLVAAGIAPLLLAAAPCLAMCALGLCMTSISGRSCRSTAVQDDSSQTAPTRKGSSNA
jgi:hypothetical protein